MSIDRKHWPKGNSPRGIFIYPRLNEPDTKYDEFGTWSVKLRLSEEAAKPLIEAMEAYLPTAVEDAEKDAECRLTVMPIPVQPAANGPRAERVDVPGFVDIMFKRSAGGRYKTGKRAGETWEGNLPIFPASGDEMVTAAVWGGTEGRLSYRIKPWRFGTKECGVKLELQAVKVLALVSEGERSASEFGFEDEEGYAPPSDPTTDTTSDSQEDTPSEPAPTVDF